MKFPLPRLSAAVLALVASMLVVPTTPLASAVQAPGGWQPLSLFDDYRNGSLRTQGTWSVNTPGAGDGAIVSDRVPAALSGKSMINQLSGFDQPVRYRGNAYAGLGTLAIGSGATGTVFFEFATDQLSETALHVGLSSDTSPGLGLDTTGDALDLDDFGPQLTIDARGLVVRDGATARPLDGLTLTDGAVYKIWLVVNNSGKTFGVHVATPGTAVRRLSAGTRNTFAFRRVTTAPLATFLHLNDPVDIPSADSYLDSLHVAPTTVATTTDPSPAFAQRLDFANLATGSINGRDGWVASSAAQVVNDPGDAANRVLELTGANLTARHAVGAIATGATGTVFFRTWRAGNVDASLGLTDIDAPTAFTDFRVQANSANTTDLRVRNGGAFTPVGSWAAGAWQCVWLVADHGDRTIEVYSRGGPYETTTRLPVDQAVEYAFRSATAGALDTFFLRTGTSSPSRLLVDDVAVDPTHRNLRIPGGDAGDCGYVQGTGNQPVANPAPQTAQPAELALTLQPVATIPSTQSGAGARINYVTSVPGVAGRLAVPDLDGPLYLLDGTQRRLYLDARTQFPNFVRSPGLGTGLGFVAFHPTFATTGRFYTVHTEAGAALGSQTPTLNSPSDTRVHGVITEWTASDPRATTFAGTRREVLRIGYSRYLHGLQQIGFNPLAVPGSADYGLLYIGSGDGDETPNFSGRPQDLGAPQGKLLRIDPRGTNGPGGRYGIPTSNPFVGRAGALGEVYALGLRNPHRFSWDTADGRMFLGVIGEKRVDGVYEVRAGDNFGWNQREGAYVFRTSDPNNVYPLPADDARFGYTYPVLQVGRQTGVSLVGGFVYRGQATALRGRYLFGDIVSGDIREARAADLRRGVVQPPYRAVNLLDASGAATTLRQLTGSSRVDLRFGQDSAGELYVLSKANGSIWKIVAARSVGAPAPSCATGTTTITNVAGAGNWSPLTPSRWRFENGEVIQAQRGTAVSGPVRPREYATLSAGPTWTSFDLRAQVRLDEPVSQRDRDVVLIFNYQSPTRFSYVHLSQDNTIYAHNGIFVVDDADRRRIDDQWNGTVGAPPAVDDLEWHDVRLTFCAATGRTSVYLDGSSTPLMTATDRTLTSGRVGFGSFDNLGRLRNLTITG